VAHLRHRQSLILMDNCEHLVDALSHIIEKLLSNAPLVDIIATSREPLLISAEKIEKIEPLTIPPDDICLSPETAMSASATRLFVARAQATTSDFLLTTDNVHLVTSICRQLDGLPLAIELAGALLASLSLEEIQIKIDSHFHELTLGYRTAPKRHQSLLNLLEWSYGLLPPAEKKALAELSIFRRSFVLDGAIKLLQLDDSSAIGLLTSLVRKSLIVSNDGDSPRSYRMLETTRAFATQKLNQTGRRDEIARRHAEHITGMFGLYDPIDVGAHRKLVTGVLDDQRSALEWALSPAGDLRIATKLTIKAAPVLFGMGLEAEHSAQFEKTLIKVLSADETFDREKMELEKMELYAAPPAWGGHAVRDVRRWSKILQKILQLAQKRDDVEFRMRARYGLFLSHIQSGRVDLALVQAKNMLEDAARVRDDGYIAMAHRMSGLCNHTLGDHNEAMQSVAALMGRHSRATNSKRSAPLTNFGLFDHAIIKDVFIARALLLDGQVAESVSTIESAAQRSHEVGHLPTVFYTYVHGACLIALMLRRAELSKRFVKLASSVNSIYTKQDPVVCQWSPLFSGWLKILEGDFEIGMSTIQEALVFLGDDFAKLNPTSTPFYGALAEGQLANGQFNAAVSTLDQALKNAHDGWGSWYDPELLRLKAEALSALKQPANEIEHAFKNSLRIAQEQGALLWQFKSAVSLADFYVSLGRVSLARKIIQPLYKTFSANPDLPWFQRATEIITSTER
jgi:predicted ATPase